MPYQAEVRHDGRDYEFTIPELRVPKCQACGETIFTIEVDDQINAALRDHLRLLSPSDIDAALKRIGMTQKEAADRLGIAEATISRWLNRLQIQSRAMDNLLRVFFEFPEVRNALAMEHIGTLGLGDSKRRGSRRSHTRGTQI